MLYHYTDEVSLYFDEDETWMIEKIQNIGNQLIEIGLDAHNQKNLFTLFGEYAGESDTTIFYGKMLHKIIAYISRSHYSILSTEPFRLQKYK